jgi:hypothetical protein
MPKQKIDCEINVSKPHEQRNHTLMEQESSDRSLEGYLQKSSPFTDPTPTFAAGRHSLDKSGDRSAIGGSSLISK